MSVLHTANIHKENHDGLRVKEFLDVPVLNTDDRFQRALLKDVMNVFYPDQYEKNDTIVREVLSIKSDMFNEKLQTSYIKRGLSISAVMEIAGMFVKFLMVYIIVMVFTYYGVQTLASWRFVREKHKEYLEIHSSEESSGNRFSLSKTTLGAVKTIAYLVLFSPAYVIAYSIRTEFNTDSVFFMIFLGVISNGLLMTYTNKFYTFLVSESRKGYIDTARAKNLNEKFTISHDGISLSLLLSPIKQFKGHLFNHIYKNAHFQYLSTIKEQASFLITGLVIIEMALNLHGNLNYELLRQILYKNYEIVIVIVLGIFYIVKCTEIFTDYLVHREMQKYENR
jgi:hypothetical protein